MATKTQKKAAATVKSKGVTKNTNTVTLAQALEAIAFMVTSAQAFAVAADKAALTAVGVANPATGDGDTSAIKKLYDALGTTGKRVGPQRQQAFKAWLKAYTPIRQNSKSGEFGNMNSRKYRVKGAETIPFDMDGAESTSFLDFVPDARPKPKFTQEKLHNRFTKLVEKLHEDIQAGMWDGEPVDVAAFQAHVNTVIADFTVPEVKPAVETELDENGEPNF